MLKDLYPKEYKAWRNMKARCYNAKSTSYPHYGARGIGVCDEWRNSFETFIKDMGAKPSVRHSLDRIDNDGGYDSSNCRWATQSEQLLNRRGKFNRRITLNKKSLTLTEWAQIVGINRKTIFWRIENGWPVRKALTVSPHNGANR